MKFSLSLNLLTPYHSAPITGGSYRVNNDGFINRGKDDGMPITRTYIEPKFISVNNEISFFPVIRSLQLVKQLRNHINDDIISSFKNRGLSIASARTYAGLMVGAASGTPSPLLASLDQTIQALKEPIALFGGGTFGLPSTVSVSDANVIHNVLINESLVSLPPHIDMSLITDIETHQMTFPVPITRADPIAKVNSIKTLDNLSVIENYHSAIVKWKGEVTESQAKRKADKGIKKGDLNNMVAVEAVVPGLLFSATISIPDNTGKAVIGALVTILSKIESDGLRMGGRVSRGMGLMAVKISDENREFNTADYDDELTAYDEWLSAVTPDDLATFYEN